MRNRETFWPSPPLPTPEEPFAPVTYYISRYQVWSYYPNAKCAGTTFTGFLFVQRNRLGKWTHKSCVYGVGDLPTLTERPELIAHKLYTDFEPATFFCLFERVKRRAMDQEQRRFKGARYSQLAQVRFHNGDDINDVRWFYRSNVV